MLVKFPLLNLYHNILRSSVTTRHNCVNVGRRQLYINTIPHERNLINREHLVVFKQPLSSSSAATELAVKPVVFKQPLSSAATELAVKDTVEDTSKSIKKIHSIFDNPQQSTIIGEDAARALLSVVKNDLKESDQLVEINPGPGLLTDLLLTETSNKMLVFEPRENFNNDLKVKYKKYIDENRLTVSHFDFLKFYTYYVYHIKSGDPKFTEFIELFPDQKDPYSSNIKIVGSISDPSFFSRIMLSTIFGVTVYGKLLPTLYILLSTKNYNRFYSDHLYIKNGLIKSSIQSKIFFNVEKLGTVKPNNVYPSINYRVPMAKRKGPQEWNIAKLEPNFKLLNFMSTTEKILLMHFLRSISRSPTKNIFCTQLEKYSRTELSSVDINSSMKVKEVALNQILVAFYNFIYNPQFENSQFKREADNLVRLLKGLKLDH